MEDCRVLVVEDESIIAKDIQDTLKSLGYKVPVIAFSGKQALKEAEENRPDLVLMDIRLKEGMDGIETAEQIYRRFNIPVIYLTACGDKDTLARVNAANPFGYILKPFKEIELYTAIQIALCRHKIEELLRKNMGNLEKVIGEKTQELLTVQKELCDAKRLSDIGALAATVAHELRNPLSVMKTAVYNIKRKTKDVSLEKHLINIDKKILESSRIINNLLSYAQIKTPRYEPLIILDVLRESINNCRDKYPEMVLKIEVTGNCKGRESIESDPLHLSELFSNILDNACQSFSAGEKKIKVNIDFNKKENKLKISFKDNGAGIEKEDLPKISDAFFTRKAKGIGLGLTVCKQIIRLHQGELDIKSIKGEGTVVLVTLPIKRRVVYERK